MYDSSRIHAWLTAPLVWSYLRISDSIYMLLNFSGLFFYLHILKNANFSSLNF